MTIIDTMATLTVGIVIGLVVGLVIFIKKKRIPKPVPVDKMDAWNHLEDLVKRKAEILAQKKAVQEALKRGKIDEKTYIEESSKLDTKLDSVEKEMNETMYLIAKGLVPEFMLDAKKEMVKLEEAIKLSKVLNETKKELEEVKSERDALYMKINELEDSRKEILAKYNWLEANSTKRISEMQETIDNLKKELDITKKENAELKELADETKVPQDSLVKSLKTENKLLNDEVNSLKSKIDLVTKELEMLKVVIGRYANTIKEKETRTLEEMKSLVEPDNENVKDLIKTYNNPVSIFEYVRDHIKEISPSTPFSFWMRVSDTIKTGAGDNNDRAILLCSMLRALGKDAKVLFVETTHGEHRALVLLDDNGVYYLLDPDKNRKFNDFSGATKEDVINKYSTGHGSIAKILYEVSDKEVKAND